MAGLLYWIPGVKTPLLRPHELEAFRSVCPRGFTQRRIDRGLGGHSGVLLVDGDRVPSERQIVDETAQRWIEADGYWVGFWKDSVPTAEDLAREQYPVDFNFWAILGDDDRWIIPQFRRADGESALPHMSAYREEEDAIRLVRFVAPRWEAEDAMGDRLWRHLNREDKSLTDFDVLTICHHALKMNYAICDTGIELLGLMTDYGIQNIAASMMGMAELVNSRLFLRPTPEAEDLGLNHG
jgi:hypothetical protein